MYLSRKNKSVSSVLALIFCMAFIVAELYIPGMDLYSALHSTSSAGVLSKTSSQNKKTDAMTEVTEGIGDEAAADIASGTSNLLSLKLLPLKHIFLKTLLLYIPLILWTVSTVLLQSGYVSRKYLIQFIHNSDGEKGEAASI